ncbi:Translation initiation factor 3 subunit c [Malassezia sp. CBS 17886]|nr:Translation initiation factor 3 subunit c [Malassezia sp. CBS 17886]
MASLPGVTEAVPDVDPVPQEPDDGVSDAEHVWRLSAAEAGIGDAAPGPVLHGALQPELALACASHMTASSEDVYRVSAMHGDCADTETEGIWAETDASGSARRFLPRGVPGRGQTRSYKTNSDAKRRRAPSVTEIKSQYYELVKTLHPDRAHLGGARADRNTQLEKFHTVVKAYELLRDPRTRAEYDQFGIGWEYGARGRGSSMGAGGGGGNPEYAYMWAEVLRRSAMQNGSRRQNWYYDEHDGFQPGMSREEARRRTEQAAPVNHRLFAALFVVAWVAAAYQFYRISGISARNVDLSAKRSVEVAQNLEQARTQARSEDGINRQRAMRERARQIREQGY